MRKRDRNYPQESEPITGTARMHRYNLRPGKTLYDGGRPISVGHYITSKVQNPTFIYLIKFPAFEK